VVVLLCCSAGTASSSLTEEEATTAAQAELAGKTHYEVLGVGTDATLPELKRAFRTLTLELHPDKLPKQAGPAERAAAQVRFLRVVEGARRISWWAASRLTQLCCVVCVVCVCVVCRVWMCVVLLW
jgi:DnaJ-domain-containing protein 1